MDIPGQFPAPAPDTVTTKILLKTVILCSLEEQIQNAK